jgi:hypothetical protein
MVQRLRDRAIVEAIAFFDSIEFSDFWVRVESARTRQNSDRGS